MSWLSSLIGGGASLVGSLFGQQNQQAINQQNIWAQNYTNELNRQAAAAANAQNIAFQQENNALNRASIEAVNAAQLSQARDLNAQNIAAADRINAMALADKERDRALQHDFAQMGIQWRVQDSLKAGIHPIYGLGGGGAAYSPSAISLGSPSLISASMQAAQGTAPHVSAGPPALASRSVAGDHFSRMGQDISRAVLTAASMETKNNAFESAYQDLTLRNMSLRNDLLSSQISRNTGAGGVQKSATESWFPAKLDVQDPQITALPGVNQIQRSPDAQTVQDRFGEGAEYVQGAHNAYEAYLFNPGAAYRYFQWVNGNIIARQMRDEYFREINVPKYQQQGPAYMRQNWKGHF